MRIILPPHESSTIYNVYFSDYEVSIMSCTLVAPLTGDGSSFNPSASLMLQCQEYKSINKPLYTPHNLKGLVDPEAGDSRSASPARHSIARRRAIIGTVAGDAQTDVSLASARNRHLGGSIDIERNIPLREVQKQLPEVTGPLRNLGLRPWTE